MSIVVTIVKFPNNVSNTNATLTFTEQGGTIGRGGDNNWILEDPERFISTRHSEISCENGYYFLTDLSTNGTFFNGAQEPIGKGNKVQLNDGDKFELSDYEFQVSMWSQNDEANLAQMDQAPAMDPGPFADPLTASNSAYDVFDSPFGQQDDPFASPFGAHVSTEEPVISTGNEETDPLAALDKAGQAGFGGPAVQSDVFAAGSHSDQANAINQAVSWPDSNFESGAIPEDWDDDFLAEPAEAPEPVPVKATPVANEPVNNFSAQAETLQQQKNELEVANSKILAEIEQLKQQLNQQATPQPVVSPPPVEQQSPHPSRTASTADLTLIEAMGLAGHNLSDEKKVHISKVVGEMVRESIIGMMQVLSSRSNIKNEFRMNVTTIQPVENNPLKFSANVDDAIDNMFIKEGNAYQKPVEAMREGFEGIAEHQIAILAGIRSAFKGVIERFDPETLEKRFEKYHKGRLIPGTQKSRNWDSYTEYYKELTDDLDNSFQHLFGYDFVQAYEEQLSRLAIARKTKNK